MSHCVCSGTEQLKGSLKHVFQLWNIVGAYVFAVGLYVLWLNQEHLFLGFCEHICSNAKKYTKTLASWQMSFALQCGHANQLAFCVSLLTLSLCFMKMPSGSLRFLSEGDFWTLCRILGAFYNHPSPAVPSLPGPVPRKWCKAVKWDCAWDPAEGKACQKGHRNFHINRAVTWPNPGWWG